MEENKNLANLCKEISSNLFDALAITEILCDLADGEIKESLLLDTIKKHVMSSFDNIETCRKLISDPD